ncbi:hypothetical protein DFP72DRAFT_1070846 [Ephemerocybe angulata]|uniref:Uncharacterized protein n=1 Tax=Ephemerocybe angulata TaxID=980116 RepID=A0A8H6HTY9_9AGAR|nr:hypothetical protein DFP72DRAFT_1070846 [Tulosesus angulatus]
MNWRYKKEEARLRLDSYIQAIGQAPVDSVSGSLKALQLNDCEVVMFSGPPCLRLVRSAGDEQEEVTVTVAGIISDKTLPPVYQLRSTKPEHVRYLGQFVRLTGLGSHTFEESQDRLREIFEEFRRTEGVDTLEGFEFGLYEEQYCIALHTRYLTDRRNVPGQRHIDFPADVDPEHALEDARDIQFIRTVDNVVQYAKKVEAQDGTARYEHLAPGEFKEGDLVEATGAFIAYPGGEAGKYKLVFALRSLALLTSAFREESRIPKRVPDEETSRGRGSKRRRFPTATKLKRTYISYAPQGSDGTQN